MLTVLLETRWGNSKALWYTVFICAMGAATQGWDQTGSNVGVFGLQA